jgi:phage-related protein
VNSGRENARALGTTFGSLFTGHCSHQQHYHRLYLYGYNSLKPVRFIGDSLSALRGFPDDARQDAGYQIDKVQRGEQPDDFKPMPSIGKGVEEIRIRDDSGAFRVIYTARLAEAVYVLHAFQKRTQATPKRDIELARERFAQLMRDRK